MRWYWLELSTNVNDIITEERAKNLKHSFFKSQIIKHKISYYFVLVYLCSVQIIKVVDFS